MCFLSVTYFNCYHVRCQIEICNQNQYYRSSIQGVPTFNNQEIAQAEAFYKWHPSPRKDEKGKDIPEPEFDVFDPREDKFEGLRKCAYFNDVTWEQANRCCDKPNWVENGIPGGPCDKAAGDRFMGDVSVVGEEWTFLGWLGSWEDFSKILRGEIQWDQWD